MLPQVQRLPGTEAEIAVENGERLGGPRDRTAHMGWHVVRALVRVLPREALGRESVCEPLQITPHGGIRVLLNDQARRRMLNEDDAEPTNRPARPNDRADGRLVSAMVNGLPTYGIAGGKPTATLQVLYAGPGLLRR